MSDSNPLAGPSAGPLAGLAAACSAGLGPAVAALAELFSVTPHEVALLRLEGRVLAFLVPERLRALGTIPLSAANASVAARTAMTGRGDLNNRFASTPHASVFEGVKLGEAKLPIQKLLSAPITRDGQTVGVAQISRKAKRPEDAPDFSPDDLARLTAAGALLAAVL